MFEEVQMPALNQAVFAFLLRGAKRTPNNLRNKC